MPRDTLTERTKSWLLTTRPTNLDELLLLKSYFPQGLESQNGRYVDILVISQKTLDCKYHSSIRSLVYEAYALAAMKRRRLTISPGAHRGWLTSLIILPSLIAVIRREELVKSLYTHARAQRFFLVSQLLLALTILNHFLLS